MAGKRVEKSMRGKTQPDLGMRKEAVLSEPLEGDDGAQAGDILFPTIAPPQPSLTIITSPI